jgi:hypothetical protein
MQVLNYEMLGRREFLISALGAAAGASAVRSVVSGPSPQAVDPRSHGAVGDGSSNDHDALEKAFAFASRAGLPVAGGDSLFAIRGSLRISQASRPWIQSLRLKQLAPANGVSTLHFDKCEGLRIDRLQVDVGNASKVGDMNSTFGLWIDGGSSHSVRNVEVSGQGKNSLIAIWSTSKSVYENLTARDAHFDDPNADDDVMQGIWLYRNTDCMLRNALASDLTGNASYVGARFANLRTRGIVLGGNALIRMVNPMVHNVDQGIDLTGSDGNRDCVISGGRSTDCGSVGVKFANSAVRCSVMSHIADRCGMYGFMASGPAEANLPFKTQDCEFVDCTSIDAGYNHISFPDPSGFIVRHGDYDFDYPKGIRFIRCRAIDRQPHKTMKYGFFTDAPQKSSSPRRNVLIDCVSQGHARAERGGAWE